MKNKQADHISSTMPKRQATFSKNFTIFFSNAGKTENAQSWEIIYI